MMMIKLSFMLKMCNDRKMNSGIFIGGLLILILGVCLIRSQITVDDVDYMEGMIPHHSIAILNSERSAIEDPRVRELADKIIIAQRKEFKEMEWLIKDIRENGIAESMTQPMFVEVCRGMLKNYFNLLKHMLQASKIYFL